MTNGELPANNCASAQSTVIAPMRPCADAGIIMAMRRRSWLKLGLGAAAVLALAGGAVALVEPGLDAGRLTPAGRVVFARVGSAVLDRVLPSDAAQRHDAVNGFLVRVEALVGALPPHAVQELSQLLALLATPLGRRGLAGLATSWQDASLADVQRALDAMRVSTLTLRAQAYQALHDISGAAYFADRESWVVLGYPGPQAI